MFTAVDIALDVKEGVAKFDEWKDFVGIAQSDGAGLQILSTGWTVDIALEATNFHVDYEDGRGKVRLRRTFHSTDGLRELAKVISDEADKIDSARAKLRERV